MENFQFYNPVKVLFGKGTIPKIGGEIKKGGFKKVLLVAGGGSIKNNGVYNQVVKSLNDNNISFIEFWGVQPNPVLTHAKQGIEIFLRGNIQAILAVGGGSVIDEAKSIAAGYYLDNLWDAFESKAQVIQALPVFTVLTLSGTCSEMDQYSVLTNVEKKKKWNIGADCLFPVVSVIDPTVQNSLPWHQTVNGAIDALSHVMEFYFLGTGEVVSISVCESIQKTIIQSVDKLQHEPDDYNSRANLAWAAVLALNGVAGAALKGGDWACHRIEHALSAVYPEIAHGAGLGIIYPAWIDFMQNYNKPQFLRWAANVWNVATAGEAIEKMKQKFRSWNAPVSLREVGVDDKGLQEIIDNVMMFDVVGKVKKLNKEEITEILNRSF